MKNLFEHFNKEKLTPEEKKSGLMNLQNFLNEKKDAKIEAPFLSPWTVFFARKTLATAFVVILIFTIGTSTTFASKYSLPGDILYPLKKIAESVEKATAISKKSQTEVQMKHTLNRLSEVEALSNKGLLNDNLKNEIQKQFDSEANQTLKNINELKNEGSLIEAAQISSNLESSLAEHKNNIEKMSISSSTEINDKKLSNFTANIENKIEETSQISISVEESIATSSDQQKAKKYAKEKLESIQKKVNDLENDLKGDIPLSTRAKVSEDNDIVDVQSIIMESQKKIEEGALKEAFSLLNEVNRKTKKAQSEFIEKRNATLAEPVIIDDNDSFSTTTATSSTQSKNP